MGAFVRVCRWPPVGSLSCRVWGPLGKAPSAPPLACSLLTSLLERPAGQRAAPSVASLQCQAADWPFFIFREETGVRGKGGDWRVLKCPEVSEETPFRPAQLRRLKRATKQGLGGGGGLGACGWDALLWGLKNAGRGWGPGPQGSGCRWVAGPDWHSGRPLAPAPRAGR